MRNSESTYLQKQNIQNALAESYIETQDIITQAYRI